MKYISMLILMLASLSGQAQERFISIDEHKIRIKTIGTGEVCVLFENGMSDSLEVWDSIPDSVANFARVLVYDRPDIGKSEPSWQARTVPNMVNELRRILQQEGIKPPYVLAGHSLGSLIHRYFASFYPDEVKGMILFDPSPEEFWKQMSKRKLKKYVKGGNEWYETRFDPQYRNEWYEFIPNLSYMDSLITRSEVPVIVVSATAWNWAKYQKLILKDFKNSRIEIWDGTHYAHTEYPDSTIRRIKELVELQ